MLRAADLLRTNGKVSQVIGTVIESNGPPMSIGETATIIYRRAADPVLAEAVGFRDSKVLLMPLGELGGISAGSDVVALGHPLQVALSSALLGRVLDGLGHPIDSGARIDDAIPAEITGMPPDALRRRRVTEALGMGVRVIDGLLTCGKGQRVGIFSGSGVGKSTLLGMIARNTTADVNVIALVGERGKEVRDFIERDLGEAGLKRSVVVVATSDQPALVRIKAAYVATRIAEFFRDAGLDVMFMMDSVTRFAMAQREVGLAIGEPTTTRGYTPSVFAALPKLLERAGTSETGTITALYTVLVEGDDLNEPVADAVRAILDGHIVLSRRLASANQFPAVDVLASVSRVMPDVVTDAHFAAASKVRDLMATYREAEDLINIGAYVAGSNPRVDLAIARNETIRSFTRQGIYEKSTLEEAQRAVTALG
ncbi:MAG: FliI/YscN family ATPase [Candidatus Lustribacter sp.]